MRTDSCGKWLVGNLLLVVCFASGAVEAQPQPNDEFVLARLKYTIGCETHKDAWNAKAWGNVLHNLHEALNRSVGLPPPQPPKVVALSDREVFAYPWLFMTGHHTFALTDVEIENLRAHVTRGGFLLATACCGSEGFTQSFERDIAKVFPEHRLTALPPDHPVFEVPYRVDRVTHVYTYRANRGAHHPRVERPILKGIDLDGRTAVILSPYALTCGWTRRGVCGGHNFGESQFACRRVGEEDSFKLGVNIVVYALTH